MWDDLLEENVMEDLDGTNFPGAVEVDADNYNRLSLINWLLVFICYWWTYFNIADRGIKIMLQFLPAFFTVLSERIPSTSLFVASLPSSVFAEEVFWSPQRPFPEICCLPKVQLII